MPEMHGFGEMIRTSREREGFSQGELARMLGWQSHSRVSHLENESPPIPTIGPKEFEVLAARLKLDRVELIEALGFRLHLSPTERVYGPLLEYLARLGPARQKALLEVLQARPTEGDRR